MLSNLESLLFHEKKHLSFLKDNAGECTLFLKRDDDSFPLEKPCSITLVGNGVRHTIIGGTGSGAVNTHYQETIEEAFLSTGFINSATDWLDAYDKFKIDNDKDFVKSVKKEARKNHTIAAAFSMGKVPLEGNFSYPIKGDKEAAIYVLSRNGGEGSDRKLEKGDILLTDSEIKDILYLNREYKKFLLVLNVPGVIDLEPVLEVRNILLLSQLGSLTGEILVDIVLGKTNPSGKLSTTWARTNDYPYINTPIDRDECLYKEGIYVGYRYFASKDIKPLFPFGFGLSYSKFEHKVLDVNNSGDTIRVKVNVKNISNYAGKEVIQTYLSHNGDKRAKYNLVAYIKTPVIEPHKDAIVELSFKLSDFPIYDTDKQAYVLEDGDYLISVGNSVDSLIPLAVISLDNEVTVRQAKNVFKSPKFEDLKIESNIEYDISKLKHLKIDSHLIFTENTGYLLEKQTKFSDFINGLSTKQLALISMGDYKKGLTGLIGQSCSLIVGGAGETTLKVKGLDKALNMVDGPAGLRMKLEYVVNKHGEYPTTSDSIWEGIKPYIPSFLTYFLDPTRNKKKKGSKVIQSATALPIATAIAQSFNNDFALNCGRLVKEEMEIYGVDIWLAPGMNIHRSILCGRNFEYYSEDPLLSAFMASGITLGVQENPNKVVCVKHFAANNQETNRLNNNSGVSEKALREIYLSGFEKVVKTAKPKTIMSSYNLADGIHTAEHRGLLIDILRCEWGYKGIVMTDWIKSGQVYNKHSIYPASYASKSIKNGVNLCMPGSKADVKDILRGIKKGVLSVEDLRENATKVVEFIHSIEK